MGRFGGAAGGAATGYQLAGPYGAAAGGVLGFLFGGNDETPPPDIQFSKESLARLAEEFPEYAKQINANQLAYGDLSRAVAKQQQGPSASEMAKQQEYMANQSAAQSMGGTAGNPMANAMMADAQARTTREMYDSANQRAMSALAMQQTAGAELASQYSSLGSLQNSARGINQKAAMARDSALHGQKMSGWDTSRQNQHNNWQDILNAGASIYKTNGGSFDLGSMFNGEQMSPYDMAANAGQGPMANFQGPEQGNWFDPSTMPERFNPQGSQASYQLGVPSNAGPQMNMTEGPYPYNPRNNGLGFR